MGGTGSCDVANADISKLGRLLTAHTPSMRCAASSELARRRSTFKCYHTIPFMAIPGLVIIDREIGPVHAIQGRIAKQICAANALPNSHVYQRPAVSRLIRPLMIAGVFTPNLDCSRRR
jgi:hypothetical protein